MERFTNVKARLFELATDEDGAVTVDWIVLTAAIVMLGMASMFIVISNVPGLTDKISSTVADQPVGN